MTAAIQKYTLGEKIFSSVVHGIGIAFGIAALSVLVTLFPYMEMHGKLFLPQFSAQVLS